MSSSVRFFIVEFQWFFIALSVLEVVEENMKIHPYMTDGLISFGLIYFHF